MCVCTFLYLCTQLCIQIYFHISLYLYVLFIHRDYGAFRSLVVIPLFDSKDFYNCIDSNSQ